MPTSSQSYGIKAPRKRDRTASRLQLKQAVLILTVIACLANLAALFLSPAHNTLITTKGEHLSEQSRLLAQLLSAPTHNSTTLRSALFRLPVSAQEEVWLLRADGTLLNGNSIIEESPMHADLRTNIPALFKDKNHGHFTASNGETVIFGGQRIEAGAWLFLTKSTSHISALAHEDQLRWLRILCCLTLIGFFSLYIHLSNITRPMNTLVSALKESQSSGQKPELPEMHDDGQIGQLSQALRETLAALHDRIETNAQFAADVAHELKNPLASLQSAAQTLSRITDKSKQERLIGIIQQDVRRMDRLISDISNASRLDSDLVRSMSETFDLRDIISPVIEHYCREGEAKNVQIEVYMPEEAVTVSGLPERLAQVIVNLVDNALSFSPENSTMKLWLHRVEGRALFVVEDAGPGIPEQALEKVFTRFYSERPAANFGEHSGLGLAISKQIVEAHDGVIWAENLYPKGARFVVGLPI